MNSATQGTGTILIMGVGNTLLQDDGVGVHVVESLRPWAERLPRISIVDGGTLGLSLLPEVESAAAVIVVDAGETGAEPGEIRVFRNADMDRQLSGRKSTVHEVAVADLLAAAQLSGHQPPERALIVIQPCSTEWGLAPTPAVHKAIPEARTLVTKIAEELLAEELAA
ncbi:MAG: hydrogenase maturation protease [Xanthomonadales bacterium]|nr:hydrogenase maturation protease [Xanthomonadales bacterium]NIX13066.1 hydrogenase maturation protease [Xanthomonadales bacterium]